MDLFIHFKVGVVTVREAIQMAEDTELDLVYYSFYFIFIFKKIIVNLRTLFV